MINCETNWLNNTRLILVECKKLIRRLNQSNGEIKPALGLHDINALNGFDQLLSQTTTRELNLLCKAVTIDETELSQLFEVYTKTLAHIN